MDAPASTTGEASAPPPFSDQPSAPWGRVGFAPPAAWVSPDQYDGNVSAREGDHVTQLLWSRQMEAGTGRSFHSSALRLETSLAVQHESQWSVQFDARHDHLTLHWLRIVRDGVRLDHLRRPRMRLIQRESQLERHIIDGSWTLIIVLDDVRPGDILESAYTCESSHPIAPGATEAFFVVPPQLRVANYRLRVVTRAEHAGLRWLASSDAPPRVDTSTDDGRSEWIWEGSQLAPRDAEPNQPTSFLDYVWVQISDVVDWESFARRVAQVWSLHASAAGILERPEFTRPDIIDEDAVVRLIRHIQDNYRYLSVALEHGGYVPASPENVVARRYGDCKDLAWLATVVLRAWGVHAHPVLVGTGLRGKIRDLLPMALAFNHAILEVAINGKQRWFDLTAREQGGRFDDMDVLGYEVGLRIDELHPGLFDQPGTTVAGSYHLRETVLLDTRPEHPSLFEQRVRATGAQADSLRQTRAAQGADGFVKRREELARARYGNKARRVGALQWRDDRENNVCELVEVFDALHVVYPEASNTRAVFDVPPNLVWQGFALPEEKARRGPWSLPHPVEVTHEITVKTGGLASGRERVREWSHPAFRARLTEPKTGGAWTKSISFSTCASQVTPEQLGAYRTELESVLTESGWRLFIPWGQSRGHRGRGFGELAERTDAPIAPTPIPSRVPGATAAPPKIEKIESHPGSIRRRRRRHSRLNTSDWAVRISVAVILVIGLALLRRCAAG